MYTSVLSLSLLVVPALAGGPESPTWLPSYAAGLEAGQKQGRPVAVFIGSGPQGQAALVKEGQFSADQVKLLAQKYVCVYLDRSQTANQRLVRELGINLAGVVISDRTGEFQAFHHDGGISQADLTKHLGRFGDPGLVVSRTISNTNQRISYYGDPSSGISTQRTVNC